MVGGQGAGGEPAPAAAGSGVAEEPFQGVTANGQPVFGLFPVAATGVTTDPLVAAADAFLEALGAAQRARVQFPVDDPSWRAWDPHGGEKADRGVSLAAMRRAAREAAFELLKVSLSERGFALVQSFVGRDEAARRYRIAVMGEPSRRAPWGWQLQGDHLVINYFVLGDQVVMSPVFLGTEPAAAGRQPPLLEDERARGRSMLESLSEAQRRMAIVGTADKGQEIIAGASNDNAILENVGIPAFLMSGEQRAALLALIELYVGYLRDGHAAVRMAEVEAHLDDTYFAWSGGDGDDPAFYYRIFSPVILIELDSRTANDHVHAIIRTPNGNDYGKALLRQYRAGQSRG